MTRWKHVVAPWLLLTFLVGAAERGSPPESGAAGGLAAAVQASPLHPAPATVGGVAQHPATIGPPQTSTLWLPPLRPAGEPAATCSHVGAAVAADRAVGCLDYAPALIRARTGLPANYGTPPPVRLSQH